MTYNDYSASVNVTYYYWVKASASSNGSNPSAFSNYDTGWRSGNIAPPQEDIIATETENKLEYNLYAFPNPVKPATEFDLKCDLSLESVHSVKIVDLNGKVVYESDLNAIETKDNIKLLSPDKQGMYLLFLKMIDGNVLYSKFIVN